MARLGPWKASRLPTSDRVADVMTAMGRLLKEKPEAAVQVPYLMVHYNPFAAASLPEQIFGGPHDQHFRYLP